MPLPSLLRLDPRYYQITALLSLLLYGMLLLHFDISALQAAITLGGIVAFQYFFTRLWRLPAFDAKSALISGLSLCLLLRANSLAWVVVAAGITIGSKFLLRWRGKHIFNPTNFGLVALLLAGAPIWVSPGQWGSFAFFAFLMICLGGLVVNRAARSDVALAFLCFYLALLFGRSYYLGEPMSIPFHRMQSGALLLFTFFMISDPKTTPNSRVGRLLFAALVAYGAWYVQFRMFRPNGLLWALALCSLMVPVLDWIFPGKKYQWQGRSFFNWQSNPLSGDAHAPQTLA